MPLDTSTTAESVEVELAGGSKTRFRAGELIFDMVDLWHNGVNHGSGNARLIVFALGAKRSLGGIP